MAELTWKERCKIDALAWADLIDKATEGMPNDRVLYPEEVDKMLGYLDNVMTTVGKLRQRAQEKRDFYK